MTWQLLGALAWLGAPAYFILQQEQRITALDLFVFFVLSAAGWTLGAFGLIILTVIGLLNHYVPDFLERVENITIWRKS